MSFFKNCSFVCRCFVLSISFLMAVFAIYLIIELPAHFHYQQEMTTQTKYYHTTKQQNQYDVETTITNLKTLEKRAQKYERTDSHKTYYIRNFAIPCAIRRIAYVQQNMLEPFRKPETLGAWLSVVDESEYEYHNESKSEKDELQGNGFMLHLHTLVWATEENERRIGIPENIEIEMDGFPTLQTTLPIGQRLNLKPDKIPAKLNEDWVLLGITWRVWLQFEDKPIPECLHAGIQKGSYGHIRLPSDFPRSLQELSVKESNVRIQSPSEDTCLSIQYDLSPLNRTEDK